MILIGYEYPMIAYHFSFAFNTKNSHNILNFLFLLLDEKVDLIKFEATEKKF